MLLSVYLGLGTLPLLGTGEVPRLTVLIDLREVEGEARLHAHRHSHGSDSRL